jgi:hypothetical protein
MAINPNTNATMSGRVTAPTLDYPYGSSKNESAPGAGDGTPYFLARADDILGFQQALLAAAGLTPSGDADTALASQYLQGIIQQVQGRAGLFDDTGAADAYIVGLRTNQQAPGAVFDGQRFRIVPTVTSTGAATIDISALLGQAAATTVISIKLKGGSSNPGAGFITAGEEIGFIYRTSPSIHAQLDSVFATDAYFFGDVTLRNSSPALKMIETGGASGFNESWFSLLANKILVTHRDGSGGFLGHMITLDLKTSAGGGLDLMTIAGPLTIDGDFRANSLGTGPSFSAGTGSPEGAKVASVGSIFQRSNGGAGFSVYFKESGTGNTGWVAKW